MIKIFINNFEIIEDAKIVVDGLVALTGESNNGKTAVYNALKVLTYNMQGTSYIRRVNEKGVQEGCKVGIFFEDINSSIVFEKADSPMYILQCGDAKQVKFDKAGRGGTPEDVATVLNMVPLDIDGLLVNLNFVDQFTAPLLMRLSEYQLYKVAVKSFDGEKIQEAISLCKGDTDIKTKELASKENEIEIQKKNRLFLLEELKSFEKLILLRTRFESYDDYCKRLIVALGFQNRRKGIQTSIEDFNKLSTALVPFYNIRKNYEICSLEIKNMQHCIGLYNRKQEIVKHLTTIEKNLDIVKECYGEDDLRKYKDKVIELRNVIELHNNRLNVLKEVEWVDRKLLYLSREFLKISIGVNRYLEVLNSLNDIKSISEKLGILKDTLSVKSIFEVEYKRLPDVSKAQKTAVNLGSLIVLRDRRSLLESKLSDLLGNKSEVDEEIKSLKYMVDNNICPTCKQIIKT